MSRISSIQKASFRSSRWRPELSSRIATTSKRIGLSCARWRSRIYLARASQMALLVRVHRFLGRTGKRSAPGLDLDEYQRLAIHRDQVDLGARAAKIALQDTVTLPPQIALRNPFASPSQRDSIQAGKRAPPEIAQIREPIHPGAKTAGELHCSTKLGVSMRAGKPLVTNNLTWRTADVRIIGDGTGKDQSGAGPPRRAPRAA